MKAEVWRVALVVVLLGCGSWPSSAQEPVEVDPAGHGVMGVYLGAISSDGRFLSYTDWSTGDLAVRDLETGESRRLTQKGTWEVPEAAQAFQAISPDGRHVAYGWQGMTFCDLRIVDIEGSEPRVLHRDDGIANILPKDWSQDGQQILATFTRKDGTDQMALISVADGSTRVLKAFDSASGSSAGSIMAFSPDGRFVVYDSRSDPDSPERDIHILSVDGSHDGPVVEHAANDWVLGWAPDGNWVLFASDREGTFDAWGIQVVDGQPHGLPRLVRSNIPPIEWGMFARDGSYYYARVVWENDVYLTTMDPESGKAQPPDKLVDHVGFNTSAEWSPGGRHLAYALGSGRYPDPFVLGIRSLETGEDVRLRLDITRLGGHAFEPHWSPDGEALLGSSRQGIRRIDAQTGEVSLLVGSPGGCPGGGECIEWPVWASDGRVIFTRFDDRGLPRRIAVRDLETGQEEELYRVNPPAAVSQLAVSRDGGRLAFVWSDTATGASALMVIPTAVGGEERELISLPPPERKVPGFDLRRGVILRPAWSPDGRSLFFTTIEVIGEDGGFELWRISSEGGERASLGLVVEGLRPYGLSVHPDGQRIALTAGTPRSQETWVMEDLTQEDAVPVAASALVGLWQGFMYLEGQEIRIEVEVSQGPSEELAGRADLRDAAVLGVPLTIEVVGRAVTMSAGPNPLIEVQLSDDHRTMEGRLFVATMGSWMSLVLEKDNEAFRRFAVPRLGYGGQYLGIFPTLDTVIVLYNGEWGDPSERVFDYNAIVEEWILPAIR